MKIFILIKLAILGFYTYLESRKNSYIDQYINSYIDLYKNSFKTLGALPYIDLYTTVKPRTHFEVTVVKYEMIYIKSIFHYIFCS